MYPRSTVLSLAFALVMAAVMPAQASSGEMNCDGATNGLDVAPFVLAVLDPSGYEAAYPDCGIGRADFDCDGNAEPDDVPGFVNCLLAGDCPVCPPQGMVMVAVGEYVMGDLRHEGGADELPVHLVSISPFYLDICEVTLQQYADGLNWALGQGGLITVTNGVVYPAGSGTSYPLCDTTESFTFGWITWNGSTFGVYAGKGNFPMMMVSWYGAAAYCNWRSAMDGREPCFNLSTWQCDFTKNGYRLPTEAEWEKAAGWDPVLSWHFRFGEHTDGCGTACLDGHRANYGSSGDPFENGAIPFSTPVGYYDGSNHDGYQTQDARSYYGCRDMSGNVWEWCYDWYAATYYATSPASDPTGPTSGTTRVQRGGSWFRPADGSRSAIRNQHAPGDRNPNDGFRCVCTGL